jgi:CheY-like chemotaxis protein
MSDDRTTGFSKYVVNCFNCRNPFDSMDSALCTCINKTRSFVCPNCLTCFCSAPQSFKLQFWSNAPQELWKRRLEKLDYAPAPPQEGAEIQRPLILLVEDERDIRAVAALAIESLGYSMIVAQDGVQGLEMARKYRPDLVITDALMPKMDGREMCRQIKDDPVTAGAKVLVISAVFTSSKYKSEAIREFRADEFLPKPIEFNTLRAVLQRLAG